MITVHFSAATMYSLNPPSSSGIADALRNDWFPAEVQFFKDEDLKDENPWFVAVFVDGEMIATSSITAFYHEGHVAHKDGMQPIYLQFGPNDIEDVHEFLVNGGEQPKWWKEA